MFKYWNATNGNNHLSSWSKHKLHSTDYRNLYFYFILFYAGWWKRCEFYAVVWTNLNPTEDLWEILDLHRHQNTKWGNTCWKNGKNLKVFEVQRLEELMLRSTEAVLYLVKTPNLGFSFNLSPLYIKKKMQFSPKKESVPRPSILNTSWNESQYRLFATLRSKYNPQSPVKPQTTGVKELIVQCRFMESELNCKSTHKPAL